MTNHEIDANIKNVIDNFKSETIANLKNLPELSDSKWYVLQIGGLITMDRLDNEDYLYHVEQSKYNVIEGVRGTGYHTFKKRLRYILPAYNTVIFNSRIYPIDNIIIELNNAKYLLNHFPASKNYTLIGNKNTKLEIALNDSGYNSNFFAYNDDSGLFGYMSINYEDFGFLHIEGIASKINTKAKTELVRKQKDRTFSVGNKIISKIPNAKRDINVGLKVEGDPNIYSGAHTDGFIDIHPDSVANFKIDYNYSCDYEYKIVDHINGGLIFTEVNKFPKTVKVVGYNQETKEVNENAFPNFNNRFVSQKFEINKFTSDNVPELKIIAIDCSSSNDLIGLYSRPKNSEEVWQPVKYFRGIRNGKGQWSLFDTKLVK